MPTVPEYPEEDWMMRLGLESGSRQGWTGKYGYLPDYPGPGTAGGWPIGKSGATKSGYESVGEAMERQTLEAQYTPNVQAAVKVNPEAWGKMIKGEPRSQNVVDRRQQNLANFHNASNNLNLTREEENLYQHHLDNLSRGVVKSLGGLGTVSTIHAIPVGVTAPTEAGGKEERFFMIPTIWNNKKVSNDEAVARAQKMGWGNFPSYNSVKEAKERYDKIHRYMESDIKGPMVL